MDMENGNKYAERNSLSNASGIIELTHSKPNEDQLPHRDEERQVNSSDIERGAAQERQVNSSDIERGAAQERQVNSSDIERGAAQERQVNSSDIERGAAQERQVNSSDIERGAAQERLSPVAGGDRQLAQHAMLPVPSAGWRESNNSNRERTSVSLESLNQSSTANETARKSASSVVISLTRLVALLVLALVIAGLFSVPVALFVLKTNIDSVSMRADSIIYSLNHR